MNKVSFIVIGAMKSGTTTLVNRLRCHPEIYIPKYKEPQYFSRSEKYCLGEQWYENLFKKAGPNQKCGEGSTCYSRWPLFSGVAERIFSYSPNILFIYLVRDPADRAYSHYRHGMLKKEFCYSSFQEAIDKNSEILSTSMYMTQIDQYLKYFPRKQFFFMRFEDLDNDEIMCNLFRFLSLKDFNYQVHHKTVSNKAGDEIVKNKIIGNLVKSKNALGLTRLLNVCLPKRLRLNALLMIADLSTKSSLGKKMVRKELTAVQSMTPQERQDIYTKCAKEIKQFQEFSGLDLSVWSGQIDKP